MRWKTNSGLFLTLFLLSLLFFSCGNEQEKRQVESEGLLEFQYAYNSKGELSDIMYPGNLQVTRQYDAYGNLGKVLADGQTVWELTGASGTVYTTLRGGTLTSTETRNAQGLLTNLKTTTNSNVVHNMDFVFNGTTGNLTSRTGMFTQAESFEYDNADRLTTVKHGSATIMSRGYKPNGNIDIKTGLGQYWKAYMKKIEQKTSRSNE